MFLYLSLSLKQFELKSDIKKNKMIKVEDWWILKDPNPSKCVKTNRTTVQE